MINLGTAPDTIDGPLVPFGPTDADGFQLSLPAKTTWLVEYTDPDMGFSAEYTFAFDGERLRLNSMKINEPGNPGGYISTDALTRLRIPKILHDVVYHYNSYLPSKLNTLSLKDTTTLAQYYYAEFACDGAPRKSLMEYMDWSRTNANYHITKFAKAGLIPENRLRY